MPYGSRAAVLATALTMLLAPVSGSEAVVVERLAQVRSPTFGARRAIVTVYVWCNREQYCTTLDAALQELLAKHPAELRIVYRMGVQQHRPTKNTEAMLEAWEQGRFLEFRKNLLRQATTRGANYLETEARRTGLDLESFRKALADEVHLARIRKDSLQWTGWRNRRQAISFNGSTRPLYNSTSPSRLEQDFVAARQQALKRIANGEPILAVNQHTVHTSSSMRSWRLWTSNPRQAIPENESPTRGPKDADITIVVFGTLPSGPTRGWIHDVEQARAQYPDLLRMVYKHYESPFRPGGADALACAHLQGKAWAYIDEAMRNSMYVYRHERVEPTLLANAGVDLDQMAVDLREKRCQKAIQRDFAQAQILGIRQPSIFVNGRRLPGSLSILAAIELELRPGLLQRLSPWSVSPQNSAVWF